MITIEEYKRYKRRKLKDELLKEEVKLPEIVKAKKKTVEEVEAEQKAREKELDEWLEKPMTRRDFYEFMAQCGEN